MKILTFIKSIISLRIAYGFTPKKKPTDFPYWDDPRIHSFSNNNWIHANVAPLFTKILDERVYRFPLREEAFQYFANPLLNSTSENVPRILDIGCGTGTSTLALNSLGNVQIDAIDTSQQMIDVAKRRIQNKNINFQVGNGHTFIPKIRTPYDLGVLSFVLHEVPRYYRLRLLKRLGKLSKKVVCLDIDPKYKPSKLMLAGEPYLLDYKENISKDFAEVFMDVQYYELVENHAVLWVASQPGN